MRQTAIWIDSQEARVFHIDAETFDEATIHSPAQHVHRHPKDQETRTRNHPQDEARFFAEVVEALRDRDALLIVGPSVTKTRFLRYAREHAPAVAARVVGVETADHPTYRALVARVRHYFQPKSPLRGATTTGLPGVTG